MNKKRVYIEKKKDIDRERERLLKEFIHYLGIKSLKDLRVINVYDIIGVTDEDSFKIIENILYEPQLDYLYMELPVLDKEELAFRVKYLEGQFNQREEAIKQLMKHLDISEDVEVFQSLILILKGIDMADLEKIKSYFINPVEMEEIGLDFSFKKRDITAVEEVEIIEDFIRLNRGEMEKFKNEYGIGMDMDDILFCQEYFKKENKNPTITEIKLIDTYWSDHCRHTTFNTEITDIRIHEGKYKEIFEKTLELYLSSRNYVYEDKEKPVCLMDLATINMKEAWKKGLLDDREISDEVNAASIEIDVDVDGRVEKWLLMFKNETHNHPTEIEPFGGAGTCLGGAIRDPLSGRSFVYQAMRISGSADPRKRFEATLAGKLPQRKISQDAMAGYSSYGNEIGLATAYAREIYHQGFLAKRLECGALVAAAPKAWVYRGKAEPGDVVILLGGRTGQDGLGGAVGSSQKHTEQSLYTSGSEVQKGNPALERKILRLFRKEAVSKKIKVCNDFGAGGVGVAIGELADGISIDLDKVPLKYPGLDGTEIALSESQERMAVVIDRKDLNFFIKEAEEEDLEATLVAQITEEKSLKMYWQGKEIVNIKREFLATNGVSKKIGAQINQPKGKGLLAEDLDKFTKLPLKEAIFKMLGDLNIGSQKGMIEKFDNTAGANTVLMPYGGENQLSPSEGMVGRIPVLKGKTNTCSIMTYGYEPKISQWSPFHGAYYAVIESIAKVVALGGDYRKIRFTFQEYFERLGEDENKWGKPLAALLGAYLVQKKLGLASIGGKDSMSGSFEDLHVPPTLISFAITTEKIDKIISNEFKGANNKIVLLPLEMDENHLLDFEQLKATYIRIKQLIDKNIILSAQSIKYGGVARALCEMAFGNKIGFDIEMDKASLFKPLFGSIVVEISADVDLEDVFSNIRYQLLGRTRPDGVVKINGEVMELDSMIKAWEEPLMDVFFVTDKKMKRETRVQVREPLIRLGKRIAKPRVLIPIFTGSHGEYTTGQAFERAGAQVETFVFKSLNKKQLKSSYKYFAKKIRNSQIIALPHGSILANEPESGGKLIRLIFTNPYIKEEINKHLKIRDGLILGIGDGFQALLKTGLIDKGQVLDTGDTTSYLASNRSGSFISTMVDVEVTSKLSPWMNEMELGHIYTTALACREGQIKIKDEKILREGQAACRFVASNPTGSIENIEALTSPDGRVLGTISAIDRQDGALYKNIEIKGEHKIFQSGVNYFK